MHRNIFSILAGLIVAFNLYANEGVKLFPKKSDSLSLKEITFSPDSASLYISKLLRDDLLWKPDSHSIKQSLSRLVSHYNESFDSVAQKLTKNNFIPASFHLLDTVFSDTLALRWLNDSTFIIDTAKLDRDPLFLQRTIVRQITDSIIEINKLSPPTDPTINTTKRIRDTVVFKNEVEMKVIIDSALLKANNIQLYQIKNRRIYPRITSRRSKKRYHFTPDGTKLILSKPITCITAENNSPFYIVSNKRIPDSLSVAANTLLSYTHKRDSIQIFFNNIEGSRSPFWLTTDGHDLKRYWVKNQKDDSVSLWLGNPDKSNITFLLEDDIHIERIEKETVDDIPFTMATPHFTLAKVEPIKEIPVHWDFDFSSSLSFSENYLSNWATGGENSISSLIDINGKTTYTDKANKSEWTSTGRLKYGSVVTDEYGIRKNTDILEFDSKYNKTFRKKTAFSAPFYMKTQIAEGYNYPNDSVVISKFLNPATISFGIGIEYKPVKKSTINFSIITYKNTFVLDTINIDPTLHGIEKGKRAKQEMGGQILIKNEFNLFDDLKVNNTTRLFSNYLEDPQNVDIEWEVNLEKQLSLYFTILLNIHIIYDDDILLPKLDENKKPIVLEDGTEVKIPQLQFKQFLGLTFLFKL